MKSKYRFLMRPLLAALLAASGSVHGEDAKPGVALKLVAQDLVSPVVLAPLEDSTGRNLVVDQVGVVYLYDKDWNRSETPFLDARPLLCKLNAGFDERGLLGLALHPKFKENGRFFAFYNAPLRAGLSTNDWDCTVHLSEFKTSPENPNKAETSSEKILLTIDKPYFNHNGGSIAFGPDGYLYISVGDGGGDGGDVGRGHPPQGNGQDLTTLMGKMLRIDVNGGSPYGIPKDNPFLDGKARPEIYAYGLRNPWRTSFDRGGTHELFAADVGQSAFEEVDIIVKGGNYGWNTREGFHPFNPKDFRKAPDSGPEAGADGKPFVNPILEYKNLGAWPKDPEARGISITGGYVYRGKALPELQGRYLFADWAYNWVVGGGTLFSATRPADTKTQTWSHEVLEVAGTPKGRVPGYIVAMGQDADGEVYVLTNTSNALVRRSGKVQKLVPR